MDRRSFMKALTLGSAAALYPAKIPSASAHDDPLDEMSSDMAAHSAIVLSRTRDGELNVRREDGWVGLVPDPNQEEVWVAGDEIVIEEEFTASSWEVVNITRLFRSISGSLVIARNDDTLITVFGDPELMAPAPESLPFQLQDSTEARGSTAEDSVALPLEAIEPGHVLKGEGYLSPDHQRILLARVGIWAPSLRLAELI